MNRIINLARAIADLFEPVPDFVTTAQLSAALGVERADHQTMAHIREWMWQQGWRSTVQRIDGIHVRGYAKPAAPVDEASNLRALIAQYGNASYRHDVGAASALGKKINALLDALPPAMPTLTRAARDVLAERARQVASEGYTAEHDATHTSGQLSDAAACYALGASHWPEGLFDQFWPWEPSWWKPTTPRRNLEKAGALILAQMELIDAAAERPRADGCAAD